MKRTTEENSLRAALAIIFTSEWIALSPADRANIVRDCTNDGGVQDLAEYRRSIGPGNLQNYADCQRVRFAKA